MKWQKEEVTALFKKPLFELINQAHQVLREYHPKNGIQMAGILNIKTGACPENCGYCSQSGHHNTDLEKEKLMSVEEVVAAARNAKAKGLTRFCIGAAWKTPPKKDFPKVVKMVEEIKALGLECCITIGTLQQPEVDELQQVGLDYYNHNLDTSERYYPEVVTTRSYQDRLDTLSLLADSDINVCCGGILGLGETEEDRIDLLCTLANLPKQPKSVPINTLVKIPGTPLANVDDIDSFAVVRTIAAARIMFPESRVRLTGGRGQMNEEMQALCFFAGANSIHSTDNGKYLTTPLKSSTTDNRLLERLDLHGMV